MEKLVIIGAGPSGLTAAIYAARANLNPLVITGKQPGGQLMTTTEVENFPGFPDGIMGPKLMMDMQKQAQNHGARVQSSEVTEIEPKDGYTTIHTGSESIDAKAVIIASGASARYLDLPGIYDLVGKGVHTCATCDGAFYKQKELIIVGGGDSAMEEATFLAKHASKVTLLHRSETFRASPVMLDRAKKTENIVFETFKTITQLHSENDKLTAVEITNVQTGEKEVREIDGLFIAIGHDPNTEFTKGKIAIDEAKYIVLQNKEENSETNVKGVFAAGDVHDHSYRQAITAAGYGCMAALDAQRYLDDLED